jgi:DNA-directed RNA polymerase I, II, and III subunit RPABC2
MSDIEDYLSDDGSDYSEDFSEELSEDEIDDELGEITIDKLNTIEALPDIEQEELIEEEEEIPMDDEIAFVKYDMTPNTEDLKKMRETKKTRPILSKYEKTKLVGERAQQIAMGAPIYVDVNEEERLDSFKIAEKEVRERKVPLLIRRFYMTMKGPKYEDWRIEEFIQV